MALKENQINLNVIIDRELAKRFSKIAKHNDTDSSKLIRQFVKKYVSENANLALL